jgi:hypothetical protein
VKIDVGAKRPDRLQYQKSLVLVEAGASPLTARARLGSHARKAQAVLFGQKNSSFEAAWPIRSARQSPKKELTWR